MVIKERLVEVPEGWKKIEGAMTAPKGGIAGTVMEQVDFLESIDVL